jgi:hypothetical protein
MQFVSHDRTFLRGLSNRVLELRRCCGKGVRAEPASPCHGSYLEFEERTGSEAPASIAEGLARAGTAIILRRSLNPHRRPSWRSNT